MSEQRQKDSDIGRPVLYLVDELSGNELWRSGLRRYGIPLVFVPLKLFSRVYQGHCGEEVSIEKRTKLDKKLKHCITLHSAAYHGTIEPISTRTHSIVHQISLAL